VSPEENAYETGREREISLVIDARLSKEARDGNCAQINITHNASRDETEKN
jgi:hypothetical protein